MNATTHADIPTTAGIDALNPQDRACCAVMAALLHTTAAGPRFGWRAALAAAAWLLFIATLVRGPRLWPAPVLGASIGGLLFLAALLGLLLRICLFRIRFDARLFEALAQGHIATLDALDSALHLTTRRRGGASAPGDLPRRIQSTKVLLGRGALLTLGHTAALVLALVLTLFLLRGLAP